MSLVIDSSIAISWLIADEKRQATDAVLDLVIQAGACVSGIWHVEVANALRQAMRRGRLTTSERDRALGVLAPLDIQIDEETAVAAWSGALAFADKHDLTAYDATYLEFAIRRALPLATLDKQLRAAAMVERVPLLGV